VFQIVPITELQSLEDINKEKYPKKDAYDDLMFEIQKHLVDINDLKEKNSSKTVSKIVDLSILTGMLALHEGASKKLFNERREKFK
jgi:hypothetical protein|tara:strand:+ start:440 stop:697 length:258 start_codon:yes stop_codon:yes gene_type:complete